jgi:hypothetical protein
VSGTARGVAGNAPASGSIIQLEFNELTPRLMFRFMEEGQLPNFRRFFQESRVFTTDAEEEGLNLNPWIQWVTVHSGVRFSEHGIFLLGEGGNLRAPVLGDVISDAGHPVWLCGSMNVRCRTPLNGALLPDAWAADAAPYPAELEPFFRFVQHNVMEHTNEERRLAARDLLAFLRFMASHGLSAQTAWAIARQLLRERSGRGGWRRVAILDRLQFDVFRWYYRRLAPRFATFFLNSVAHLQHTHWRNLEPESFSLKPTPQEQAEFEDAVLFGYRENDRLIGRFLELAGDDTTLIFLTALSQQPDSRWEESGGKHFYRPRDFARVSEFAGITAPHRCSPVMSEEFWLEFGGEAEAVAAESALAALRVGAEPAFRVQRKGSDVYAGCALFGALEPGARLENPRSGATIRFFDLLYQADSLKSGRHHPDGLLWIRTPDRKHLRHEGRVPLTCVAPTVLSLLGVAPPESMRGKPLL